MEHEASARFDRTSMMDSTVRSLAGIDIELLEQTPEAQACPFVANPDSNSAILVMHTHGDDGPLEPRIRHARHRKQQLARQESRLSHPFKMVREVASSKP